MNAKPFSPEGEKTLNKVQRPNTEEEIYEKFKGNGDTEVDNYYANKRLKSAIHSAYQAATLAERERLARKSGKEIFTPAKVEDIIKLLKEPDTQITMTTSTLKELLDKETKRATPAAEQKAYQKGWDDFMKKAKKETDKAKIRLEKNGFEVLMPKRDCSDAIKQSRLATLDEVEKIMRTFQDLIDLNIKFSKLPSTAAAYGNVANEIIIIRQKLSAMRDKPFGKSFDGKDDDKTVK